MASVCTEHPELPPLVSEVGGPIGGLSRLRQSLLFAELSLLAYYSEPTVRCAAGTMGFTRVKIIERDGAQAYVLQNANDCVIACRGTELTNWNDIKADLSAGMVVAETVGRVHRGFKQEVDELWPDIEDALAETAKPVWFTGHSLGGAMATICAGRCEISPIAATPAALFTYGCPRVGNRRYINYVQINHFRWVNNNDLVTRLPPAWLGYRHCGCEIYLDHEGHVRRLSGWPRFRDRVRGLLAGLEQFRLDYLADHSILKYIDRIQTLVAAEQPTRPMRPLVRPRRRTERRQTPSVPPAALSDRAA